MKSFEWSALILNVAGLRPFCPAWLMEKNGRRDVAAADFVLSEIKFFTRRVFTRRIKSDGRLARVVIQIPERFSREPYLKVLLYHTARC